MDDQALLRDYLEHQSEKAFSELVERHLPLVYGTALRLTGDSPAAQDVAQTVFIQLARQAWTIRQGHALPGWLYRATRHAAFAALRSENRRRQRETEAMKLAEPHHPASSDWEQFAPLLDEALGRLSRVEQDAVVLRFFEDQSFREVGAALGLQEDAARKRTERSLEKIRAHFARRGVTTTAALLGSAITAHAAAPPPAGLAAKVGSVSPTNAAAAGVLGFILRKIFFMSTQTKIIVSVALVAALAALFVIMPNWQNTAADSKLASQPPTKPSLSNPVTSAPALVKGGILSPNLTPAQIAALQQPLAKPNPIIVPVDRNLLQAVTKNLRLLANAARVYMAQHHTTTAGYNDLVGSTTDAYMGSGSVTPVMGEDYTGIEFKAGQSQVTISTPDGTVITYNL